MDSKKVFDDSAVACIAHGDVAAVRRLLDQDMDPKNKSSILKRLMEIAIFQNFIEIIKLLVEYGATVERALIKYIFKLDNNGTILALLKFIINHNKDADLSQKIFLGLVEVNNPAELMILQLLLDHGLPINDSIDDEGWTPLHYSAFYKKIDFILRLLELGADVNQKTSMWEQVPLILALEDPYDHKVVKLLLKKGALVDEKTAEGQTALYVACSYNIPEAVSLLLEHGAEINYYADDGRTPLMRAYPKAEMVLLKELAVMKFESQPIWEENLNYINKYENSKKMFKNSLKELKKLKDYKFFNSLSLYDILKMKKQHQKLTNLTKNENFVKAFRASDRKSFELYGNDLVNVFQNALERRNILQLENEKLYSTLKDFLPSLVINKLAYFSAEYLFDL